MSNEMEEARGEIKGVIRFCHDKMHYSVDAIIEAIREQFNLTQASSDWTAPVFVAYGFGFESGNGEGISLLSDLCYSII